MMQQLEHEKNMANERVKIAVFDFDGTCINGNSPVLLVRYLMKKHMLSKPVIGHIASWALRYKFHLPQSERKIRTRVFSAFKGKQIEEVDAFLAEFYQEKIRPLWRQEALDQIELLRKNGYVVIAVSATFEPIIRCAMQEGLFDYSVSTVMRKTPDGRYTDQVDGEPVEGVQKITAICGLANEQFGEGNWEIAFCFADHYSDIDILSQAAYPVAVSPDATLHRHAKRNDWRVVHWKEDA